MTKINPKITVIIDSFNHGKFIKQSINSVLNQSFKDFELIIWDDASPDNSWEVIKSFKDHRIRSYQNKYNTSHLGLVDNVIKNYAKGEYVALLHSDDYWHTDKLKIQYEFLSKNKEYGACYTWANIIDDDGIDINDSDPHFNIFRQPNRSSSEWIKFFFESGNAICHPSNLVRKKCYEEVGFYQERGHGQLADLRFHIKFCFKFKIHIIDRSLIYFRRLKSKLNMSAALPENQARSLIELFKLLDLYKENINLKNIFVIFPEYKKFNIGNETIVDFVFARICIDSNYHWTRTFGLSLLFDLFRNVEMSEEINKKYNFKYKDYLKLTGTFNSFSMVEDTYKLVVQRDEMEKRMLATAKELEKANERLHARIGRRVKGLLKKIF